MFYERSCKQNLNEKSTQFLHNGENNTLNSY